MIKPKAPHFSHIKNFDELASSKLRRDALRIIDAGLEAIDTRAALKRGIRLDGSRLLINGDIYNIGKDRRIFVVGAGKCSFEAALAMEEILGDRLSGGIVISVHMENPGLLKKIKAYQGTHPLPSENNVLAAKAIADLLLDLKEDDFVIFLISGGGSTLLCLPEDMKCEDEAAIMQLLMKSGATIEETNTIRKHISLVRGGFLAKYAYPAEAAALIFSDVPNNDPQFIASGPTVKDSTTVADAVKILEKYEVVKKCGIKKCGFIETPKEDKYFERIKNIIFISNTKALEAMREMAAQLGYRARICDSCLSGEAREVAVDIAGQINNAEPKTVLLYGGETTVTVKAKGGKGGRNLELALAALLHIKKGTLMIPVASDGRDNTDFAGGICDIITLEKARESGIDPVKYFEENKSYAFFEETGDYLMTGDTGSNVSDLIVAIKE